MTNKQYTVSLNNIKIGTTELEHSDAPMGVVFGKINFLDIESGYKFFKTYCSANGIDILTDYPEDKILTTGDIPSLIVTNQSGVEIKGVGCNIEGMDSDKFDILILGVPYPFYEEEFPHHVKFYRDKFNA